VQISVFRSADTLCCQNGLWVHLIEKLGGPACDFGLDVRRRRCGSTGAPIAHVRKGQFHVEPRRVAGSHNGYGEVLSRDKDRNGPDASVKGARDHGCAGRTIGLAVGKRLVRSRTRQDKNSGTVAQAFDQPLGRREGHRLAAGSGARRFEQRPHDVRPHRGDAGLQCDQLVDDGPEDFRRRVVRHPRHGPLSQEASVQLGSMNQFSLKKP